MKLISKDVCGRRCLKAGVAKNYYQVQHVTMTTLRVASTHILLHCFSLPVETSHANQILTQGRAGLGPAEHFMKDMSNRETSVLTPKGQCEAVPLLISCCPALPH